MAARLATLNAILERKKLEKEREECEARGEVWVPPKTNESPVRQHGDERDEEDLLDEPNPGSPTKEQLTSVAELLGSLETYKEGEELAHSELGISLFAADPFYDDGYDAPFNQVLPKPQTPNPKPQTPTPNP
jgi:hypothetical protein